jgi:hypothetical protein
LERRILMPEYHFDRECRTPYSEAYSILSDEAEVGRVDLHFTDSVVYAGLAVTAALTDEVIHELLEAIDEELVLSAGVMRDDFIVTVYQGRQVGVFSDEEDFEEDEEEEEGNGHRT